MKKQLIIPVLILVAIVGLSFYLYSKNSTSDSEQIEKVIEESYNCFAAIDNFQPSDDDLETILGELTVAISSYTERAREIDLSQVPKEFASAYIDHIQSWEDLAMKCKTHPRIPSGVHVFFDGFVSGFTFGRINLIEKYDRLEQYAEELQSMRLPIQQTWHDVEDIALRYGVQIQESHE